MARKREDGFYWVRPIGSCEFKICECVYDEFACLSLWYFTGSDHFFYGKDFMEIDERRIERDE